MLNLFEDHWLFITPSLFATCSAFISTTNRLKPRKKSFKVCQDGWDFS